MSYWRATKLDNARMWNEEEAQYYEKHCLQDTSIPFVQIFKELKEFHNQLMQSLEQGPYKDLLFDYLSDYEEFAHWMSVVASRNHGIKNE